MAKKHSYKSLSAAGTQLRWLDCLIRLCLFTRVAKLAAYAEEVSTSTGFGSEEWGSGWRGGTNFLVEVEETAAMSPPPSATRRGSNNSSTSNNNNNGTSEDYNIELGSQEQVLPDATGSTIAGTTNGTTIEAGPKIIVRTEEVLIVGLVLILWVGAIMLFFNRWGKIRMLEPYQPKFQQQHRSSCPLVDLDAVQAHQRASVSRMSMGMVHQHNLNMPTCQFAAYNPSLYAKGYASHVSHVSRPRQNSVFVGATTSHYLMPRPPRKTRSAMDLHSMVLDESAEQV